MDLKDNSGKNFMFAEGQNIMVKIHNDISSFNAQKPVITIGTFDGVHLGHQKVIARMKEIARKYEG